MPTDPVYNPHLPSSAAASTASSAETPWKPSSSATSWSPSSHANRAPSSSRATWTPSSSEMRSTSPWSGNVSMEQSRASWSAMSAGLIAGAVAGAAIALMFAPSRGSELRGSIRRYASNRTHRLNELVQSGRSMAGDAVQRASSLVEQGRNSFRTGSSGSRSHAVKSIDSPSTDSGSTTSASMSTATGHAESQPLTASVAEISGLDRRFEEPMGG